MRQTLTSTPSPQRRLVGSSRNAPAAAAARPSSSSSSIVAAANRRTTTAAAAPKRKTSTSLTKPSSPSSSNPRPKKSPSRFYLNVTGFPFPLGPFFNRKTIRTELEKNSIWLFEQPQGLGLSNVTANVRMTVIKLEATGGLWVHAPVAPTRECVELLKELGSPVEHIVLPTFAYEHKCFMGPFCRAFPEARAWVAPRQWSWPVNLPVQFFGIFPAGRLTEEAADPRSEGAVPWLAEIDHKPFASSVGIGPYSEVAFYHKKSRTLLVTDAVVQVPRTAPAVVEEGALLEAGGPLPAAVAAFSAGPPGSPPPPPPPAAPAQRAALGWKRMALQILFFVPGDLGRPERSFDALAGKMIVSPVLRKLVFGNARREALAWIDEICSDWPKFNRILPCHFEAPIRAGPRELRAAFSFLEEEGEEGEGAVAASTSGRERGGEEEEEEGKSKAGSSSSPGALLGGLFSALSKSSPIKVGGGGGGAVPFDPADMRALDGLSGSLKTTGVLNK